MTAQRRIDRLFELIRFYQAAAVNAAFGFGLFALFIYCGMNIYLAQISAHILGIVFNYFTYSRHVFRDTAPAKLRFVMAYVVNYGIGLAVLLLVNQVIESPYIAGFVTLLIASIINYFALKYGVFTKRTELK